MKQVIESIELLSAATVDGETVATLLRARGVADVTVTRVEEGGLYTDFLACTLPGLDPGLPALGLVGRLGGVGARPAVTGLVSDADGAIVAIATALKLADMAATGDVLAGPVRIHTHICPHAGYAAASSGADDEIAFRDAQDDVGMKCMPGWPPSCRWTPRGATASSTAAAWRLTPVAKEGWLLRLPERMLDVMGWVSGELPAVLPLTTQDVTPYENGLWHVNSIMQPGIVTTAPVIGVALTAQTTVPGCATGVTNAFDLDVATRFCIEVAKLFGPGNCAFYDEAEWAELLRRYGSLAHLQTVGREA
ncbi:DUF1177 family protein [Cupriavidus basilensis]